MLLTTALRDKDGHAHGQTHAKRIRKESGEIDLYMKKAKDEIQQEYQ